MTQTLKMLEKAEAKAWNTMARGSEEDASSEFGKHGKNYVAWCAAADACYEYRKTHDLLGKDEGR